jgi:hypothetical protein
MSIVSPPSTPPSTKAVILRSGSGAKTWIENRFFKAGSRIGIMSDLPPASVYLKSHEIFQNAVKTYPNTPASDQGLELDYDPATMMRVTNPSNVTGFVNAAVYDLGSVFSRIVVVVETYWAAQVRQSDNCSSYTTVLSQSSPAPIAIYVAGRCIAVDIYLGAYATGYVNSIEGYSIENPELSFPNDTQSKIRIASRGNWWLYEVMPL